MKRRSRRYAIAMIFAADIGTFEAYQPGTTVQRIYTDGRDYYVALRSGEHLPVAFGDWFKMGDSCDYQVYGTKL